MSNNENFPESEIMTLAEVAHYLKLAEGTVLNLVNRNEIPCFKVGDQYKFIKPVIDDWILSKANFNKMSYNEITKISHSPDSKITHTSSFFDKDFIVMDIKKGSKEEVLRQLAKPLVDKKIVYSEDFYLLKLIERENISSTGIGHGLAIPHIKNIKENSKNSPYLVFGICKEGTDFASHDRQPTYLFFLLSSQKESIHLKVMAKISKMFMNEEVKNRVINSSSLEDLLDIFKNYDIDSVSV